MHGFVSVCVCVGVGVTQLSRAELALKAEELAMNAMLALTEVKDQRFLPSRGGRGC